MEFDRIFRHNAPFDIQIPSSLRDPHETTFSIDDLASLRTVSDARRIALEHLHDPEQFASFWNSDEPSPETRRLMRKLVQIQTINAVCNGFYRSLDGTKIELDTNEMNRAALNTKQHDDDSDFTTVRQQRSYEQPAAIFVIQGDCLDTALHFEKKYPNCSPVVLNMANAQCPGGGWRQGCGAQEENLHRRTNLFQCLEDSYHQFRDKRDWSYPIPEFGGLYSPKVSVFRGSESQGYPFFPDGPKYLSFIACAAYAHPQTCRNENGEFELSNAYMIHNTMKKMNAVLKIALENEHDTVILSAFGCGAFRNPPRHIAQLFHQVISKHYSRSFKHIVFAIIEDHNSMQRHNSAGNLVPFSEVFNVPILSINDLNRENFF